ncbi:MAG: NADH-quinone oxidoreductase subunit J [Candidatus Poribacteria bacterium]
MDISPCFFYLFAGLAIAGSLFVILKKNPVSSAFSLILVFFSFAGIYALLDAHLVAAIQILVYAGAIMVLFIFVIMLLNSDVVSLDIARAGKIYRLLAVAAGALGLCVFVWAFRHNPPPKFTGNFTIDRIEAAGGNTRVISEMMFSEYILPFELTSVVLLVAIVGAVAIARRKPSQNESGGHNA